MYVQTCALWNILCDALWDSWDGSIEETRPLYRFLRWIHPLPTDVFSETYRFIRIFYHTPHWNVAGLEDTLIRKTKHPVMLHKVYNFKNNIHVIRTNIGKNDRVSFLCEICDMNVVSQTERWAAFVIYWIVQFASFHHLFYACYVLYHIFILDNGMVLSNYPNSSFSSRYVIYRDETVTSWNVLYEDMRHIAMKDSHTVAPAYPS